LDDGNLFAHGVHTMPDPEYRGHFTTNAELCREAPMQKAGKDAEI
jgi:hypothetical protein